MTKFSEDFHPQVSAHAGRTNGTAGDVTAADLVFSFQATVVTNTTLSTKSLPVTVSDAQGRMSVASITLTVVAATPALHTSWGRIKTRYR